MDQNMKREIILDNYQNPKNRGLVDNSEYQVSDMDNESCIDHVTVQALIKNDIIEDVRFDGEACAICTSSASIMTGVIKGKKVDDAKEVITNFSNMINNLEYDPDKLEEASVYSDIANQPNRKKCALLSWWAIDEILNRR